tara:strand:+ start:3473 stop:3715 length:243 start_codon:yes stop_codon:yes gene_type:complete
MIINYVKVFIILLLIIIVSHFIMQHFKYLYESPNIQKYDKSYIKILDLLKKDNSQKEEISNMTKNLDDYLKNITNINELK